MEIANIAPEQWTTMTYAEVMDLLGDLDYGTQHARHVGDMVTMISDNLPHENHMRIVVVTEGDRAQTIVMGVHCPSCTAGECMLNGPYESAVHLDTSTVANFSRSLDVWTADCEDTEMQGQLAYEESLLIKEKKYDYSHPDAASVGIRIESDEHQTLRAVDAASGELIAESPYLADKRGYNSAVRAEIERRQQETN